ncbi:MAG: glycosyltransferase family 4 protein [Nitrososphaerota archaeon]
MKGSQSAILRVAAVIPAKGGVTGASLALAHIMLGIVTRYPKKVKVTIITSREALEYPAIKRLKLKGAEVIYTGVTGCPSPLYWLALAIRLLSLLRHGRVDIIHFSTPKALVYLYPAARIVARKIVISLEGYPPHELEEANTPARLIGILAWRLSQRIANKIAPCSEWLRRVCIKAGAPEKKLTTIHNPVDVERFTTLISRQHGSRDVTNLLFVGRLHPVKGIDVALKALSLLKNEYGGGLFLRIVGVGPQKNYLERMVYELGLEKQVAFMGYRHDVEELVKESDIVLAPSRYEPFGMVAAEGGAAGKPVIASRVGGLIEIVEDGVTGLLFTMGDPRDLAQKILQLATDKSLSEKLGENAKERVSALFAPEVIAEKMVKIYREVLED